MLVDKFGSMAGVLATSPCDYQRIIADYPTLAHFLADVSASFREALAYDVRERPLITNSEALSRYLHIALGQATSEYFRVLFLDVGHYLIRDQLMGSGSLSEAPVYPREIVKRALELGAAYMILVHNHPSGDPSPSQADIETTRRVAQAARLMDIIVSDHIIVSRSGWVSLRARGLL